MVLSGRVVPLDRFDAFQARRGAHAALEVDRLRRTGTWRGGMAGALDRVRRRAEVGLARGLPAKEAALLRGMVLGQDERLSEAVRTDFQRSGLAHILAVSGQNVVLLAILALAAGMVAGIGLRARLAVALALVVVYVPLAGGGPSIQRAGVMGGAGLVAALAGRPASRWYALGLAAAATLALNPRVSGEPGWQLSFAAVVGLLALVPRWREGLRRAALPGPVADAAAVTAAATVATAPLMAFHFEQVSLASLPANLAAAAAVAPVMWLGMGAIAVAQLSPALCEPLNALNGPLLAYVEWVAHVAAQPPAAALPVRLGGPATLALTYAALAAAIALAGRAWRWLVPDDGGLGARGTFFRGGRRKLAAAAVAAAVTGLVVVPALGTPRPPQSGDFVISFLNIGQGDATLLQHGGASILFDTGPPGGPILTRLRQAGVERLDALVLTHAQLDHEGMAVPITRKYHPRLVLDGGAGWNTPTQRGLRANVVPAHEGQQLELGGIRLRLLWPPRPPPDWRPEGDPNNRAVVAIASVGSFDVLLTADAESDITGPLQLPPVEVLKVAHHGSEDPGLPALLARTKPRLRGHRGRPRQHLRPSHAADPPGAQSRRPARLPDRPRRHRPPARDRRRGHRRARPLESDRRARLQARLPDPRRRPRPHLRAPRQAARARGGRRRRLRGRGAGGRRVHGRNVETALTTMTFAMGRRFVIADGVERWKDKDVEQVAAAMKGMDGETLTIALFGREEGRN